MRKVLFIFICLFCFMLTSKAYYFDSTLTIGNGFGGKAFFDSFTGNASGPVIELPVGSSKWLYTRFQYYPQDSSEVSSNLTLKINICSSSGATDFGNQISFNRGNFITNNVSYRGLQTSFRCRVNDSISGTIYSIYFNFDLIGNIQEGDTALADFSFIIKNPVNYAISTKILSYEVFNDFDSVSIDISNHIAINNNQNATIIDILTNTPQQVYSFFENVLTNSYNVLVNIYNLLSSKLNSVISNIQSTNNKLDQANDKSDQFLESDISNQDKELPDNSSINDYESAEGDLVDKVNQADLSQLNIGIDVNSSTWVWDTLTSLIQSHSLIFGMFISILSIGIIKLALGR